jgi:hypothetical protein
MNFYWFKLDLARLKLAGIPEARYIYFIILDPIKDYDILNEIYFPISWLEFNLVQILEIYNSFETNQKFVKDLKANGRILRGQLTQTPVGRNSLDRVLASGNAAGAR